MREWKVKLAYSTVQRDSLSKEDAVPQNLAAIAEGFRALVEVTEKGPEITPKERRTSAADSRRGRSER